MGFLPESCSRIELYSLREQGTNRIKWPLIGITHPHLRFTRDDTFANGSIAAMKSYYQAGLGRINKTGHPSKNFRDVIDELRTQNN